MSAYSEQVLKMVDVMKAVRENELTGTEIVEETGLGKQSVFLIARALAEVGILERKMVVRKMGGRCFKYRLSDAWRGQ